MADGAMTDFERVRELSPETALAVDTAVYAIGDRVGTVMKFNGAAEPPGGGLRVWAVRIVDKAAQKAALNLWLFDKSPTIASADNAPLDITDAELAAAVPVGVISIAATDYVDSASNAVGLKMLADPGVAIVSAGGDGSVGATGALYGLLESAGTPTYGAAGDLTVTLVVEQA